MRNISEFNHGLVLSAEPLQDDVLFEVRIDEKVSNYRFFTLGLCLMKIVQFRFTLGAVA